MSIETKQLHALSKIYQEAVYGGAKKKSTDMVVTNADKKANTPAYKNYKAGVKGYKAADHLKNEDAQYGYDKDGNSLNPKDKKKKSVKEGMKQARKNVGADKCWDGYEAKGTKKKGGKEVPNCVKEGEKKAKKDYDGDGKIESGKAEYFGSKDKAIKKAMKKESYSDWREDLKEVPNYDQIPADSKDRNEKITEKKVKNTIKINPEMKEAYGGKKKKHDCASKVKHEQFGVGDCISEAHDLDENGNVAHYDVEFEEYIVKNVPVGELEILEKHMHEHVIPEGTYEKTKTKEVMGALKKRDLKQDVKKKIAADIVKRKGDTSKSDDRYAYENYQAMRNPEKEEKKDKRSAKQKRMDSPDKGINSPAFKEFMRQQGM